MKNFKKFSAAIAATLVAASLSIPMACSLPASAAPDQTITITGISASQAHTFEIYQVLTGEYEDTDVLNEMKWGTDITKFNGADVETGTLLTPDQFTALKDAMKKADGSTITDARDWLEKFTLGAASKTAESNSETLEITGLEPGYYIIKDVTDLGDKDDSNSAIIVHVAGNTTEVAIKNAKPTVDKQVKDEAVDKDTNSTDTDGWGETADHAINEPFQFKLTATIPADPDLKVYETYKLVFNDSMSAGVTFEGIESVKVGNTVITADTAKWTKSNNAVAGTAGLVWTLTINDVKAIAGDDFGTKDVIVEVIYNAHLNEDAIIATSGGDKDYATPNVNINTVDLSYSNNPDSTGTGQTDGKTTKDTVGVFTYQSTNTKYANSAAAGNELAGATFKLYDAATGGNEIELKAVTKEGKTYYMPVADGDEVVVMTSGADGKFIITGLDAGTYYIEEVSAPTGYNKMANRQPITISASHEESSDGAKAVLTFTEEEKFGANIINKSGSSLPSTGGMGTTLFYIGGGCMVGLAGVFLITKKRMNKNED